MTELSQLQRLQFENNGVRALPIQTKRIIEAVQRPLVVSIAALGVLPVVGMRCCERTLQDKGGIPLSDCE